MKIKHENPMTVMEQLKAIDNLLHAVAHNRGFEDELVIQLYYMAENGYSYEQIYYTYIVSCR